MTDQQPKPTTEAETFWRGRCLACVHPTHEMACHEMVSNGDPSNGPAYCPCSVNIEGMEQEIVRLRSSLGAMTDQQPEAGPARLALRQLLWEIGGHRQ